MEETVNNGIFHSKIIAINCYDWINYFRNSNSEEGQWKEVGNNSNRIKIMKEFMKLVCVISTSIILFSMTILLIIMLFKDLATAMLILLFWMIIVTAVWAVASIG